METIEIVNCKFTKLPNCKFLETTFVPIKFILLHTLLQPKTVLFSF